MVALVEVHNFRNLRDVRVPVREFQVLVGKNGSGKSAFMDAVAFLSDFVSSDLERALTVRSATPSDLLHHGRGDRIEFAVEARVPASEGEEPARLDALRYEVAVRIGEEVDDYGIEAESLMLACSAECAARRARDGRTIAEGGRDGRAMSTPEVAHREAENRQEIALEPGSSALAHLPADVEMFPAATWFRDYMLHEVHRIAFRSSVLARPNPPTTAKGFAPDGSNVAGIVAQFHRESPDRHQMWVEQLQVDWPDLVDIRRPLVPKTDGPTWSSSTGEARRCPRGWFPGGC